MDVSQIKTEDDIRRALAGKSEFLIEVYVTASKIPKGMVSTYGRIAEKVGRPKAYRAVASAMHNNPIYPVVPCHRVVARNGRFPGDEKAAMGRMKTLASEGVPIEGGRVKMSEAKIF